MYCILATSLESKKFILEFKIQMNQDIAWGYTWDKYQFMVNHLTFTVRNRGFISPYYVAVSRTLAMVAYKFNFTNHVINTKKAGILVFPIIPSIWKIVLSF